MFIFPLLNQYFKYLWKPYTSLANHLRIERKRTDDINSATYSKPAAYDRLPLREPCNTERFTLCCSTSFLLTVHSSAKPTCFSLNIYLFPSPCIFPMQFACYDTRRQKQWGDFSPAIFAWISREVNKCFAISVFSPTSSAWLTTVGSQRQEQQHTHLKCYGSAEARITSQLCYLKT